MRDRNTYSGKFTVKIPKSLHKDLIEQAETEGTSLNQYILYKLAIENTEPATPITPAADDNDDNKEYSGRFMVRVPKSLHKTISEKAKKEGTSLNQYVIYKLSR